MEAAVLGVGAKRFQPRTEAVLDDVLVQFEKKADKHTAFRARWELAGTSIGMDENITRLQQQ